jgi:type VI secretion system secreted protein Hcp
MAYDAFLKLDGIDGESVDQLHQAWIEVLSWSWGVSQPGQRMATGTGLVNTGRPSFQVFTIGKRIDKASPQLFLGCATGKHIASASLEVAKVNGDGVAEEAFIHIKMSNLLVSSYHPSELLMASSESPVGLQPDGIPVEMVSFNFEKIKYEYDFTNAAGGASTPVIGTYDVKTAKGGSA